MPTFAVIAMGEMGSAVAARLVERGARVLTSLEGRSAASAARAKAAGVEAASDDRIAAEADILLSILPPARAQALAARFLPHLRGAASPALFLDCNAVAPATLLEMAVPFSGAAVPFGDASIIGGPPQPGKTGPRLYMSGPIGAAADLLKAHGIDTRAMSERLGDASAIKMSYAGITKGFQALGTAMSLGAARSDVLEPLSDELNSSLPDLYSWLKRQLPSMPAKAYRWDGEMREIAKFLAPESGSMSMLTGAADLFEEVAREAEGDGDERLGIVARFCGK